MKKLMSEQVHIICLHGGPGLDCSYFHPYLSSTSDLAFSSFDLPSDESVTLHSTLCKIEEEANKIDGPYFLLGHSFGAMLAIEACLNGIVNPSGLILISPVFNMEWMNEFTKNLKEHSQLVRPQRASYGNTNDAYKEKTRSLSRFYFPTLTDKQANDIIDGISFSSVAKDKLSTEYLEVRDLTPELFKICIPTLCIVGLGDKIVSPSYSINVAKELPNCEITKIPNAGHFPFIEARDMIVDAVAKFVKT